MVSNYNFLYDNVSSWIDVNDWIFPLFIGILGSMIAVPALRLAQISLTAFFSKALILQNSTTRAGIYNCVYYIPWKPDKPPIKERIFLTRIGTHKSNSYRGFVVKSDDNEFRNPDKGKPQLRIVGTFFNEHSFVGYWYHPLPNKREIGSFNLEDSKSDGNLLGEWSGKSGTYKKILSGVWVWEKVNDSKYNTLSLYKDRFFGDRSGDDN